MTAPRSNSKKLTLKNDLAFLTVSEKKASPFKAS